MGFKKAPAALLVLILILASIGGAIAISTNDPAPETSPQTSSSVTIEQPGGEASELVARAIAKLEERERFRFELTLTGSEATDLVAGTVAGEVDLSRGRGDPARLMVSVQVETAANLQLAVDQIRIGKDLYVRSAGAEQYVKRKHGLGREVEIADPVTSVLRPIELLPAGAFTFGETIDGLHLVAVDLPTDAEGGFEELGILIHPEDELIRRIVFVRTGVQGLLELRDYGSSAIEIAPPEVDAEP